MVSDQPQRCRKVTSESEIAMKDFSAIFLGWVYYSIIIIMIILRMHKKTVHFD